MTDSGRTVFGRGADAGQPSTIDPATYQSDAGAGFTLELNNSGAPSGGGLAIWDTIYPINSDSTEVLEDNPVFLWDPDLLDYGAGEGPAHLQIKQSGLYTVHYRIDFDTVVLNDPTDLSMVVEVTTASADLRQRDYYAPDLSSVRGTSVRWVPEGDVTLGLAGFDLVSTEISYAYLRLAPMFTLTGVEES